MFVEPEQIAEIEMLRHAGCCCELSAVERHNVRMARRQRLLHGATMVAGIVALVALFAIGLWN
jgi:hypothetical protein